MRENPKTTLVRSAALTNFSHVARQCGLEPLALLRESGLPARSLDEPDLKVSTASVSRLLELAARRSGQEGFGVLLGESRRLSNLGPLGLLLRDEPTLRHALEAIVRYIRVHNEALVLRLESAGGLVVIRLDLAIDGSEPITQSIGLALAVTFRMISLFMGAAWQPRLVCFSHRAPNKRELYIKVFGQRVEFGHEFNGIVCNEADLDLPNPSADPVMARYAQDMLEQRDDGGGDDFAGQVRRQILMLLPLGRCDAATVAQHLGCERRTISRRLAAQGTSFHGMVDEHRAEVAARCLQDRARSLREVGTLLGFSSQTAFCRWYKNTFGVTARSTTSS